MRPDCFDVSIEFLSGHRCCVGMVSAQHVDQLRNDAEAQHRHALRACHQLQAIEQQRVATHLVLEQRNAFFCGRVGDERTEKLNALAALESTEVIRRDGSLIYCRMPDLIAAAGGDELA